MQFIAHPMQASEAVTITVSTPQSPESNDVLMNISAKIIIDSDPYEFTKLLMNIRRVPAVVTRSDIVTATLSAYGHTQQFVKQYNNLVPTALQLNNRFSYRIADHKLEVEPGVKPHDKVLKQGVVYLTAIASIISENNIPGEAIYHVTLYFENHQVVTDQDILDNTVHTIMVAMVPRRITTTNARRMIASGMSFHYPVPTGVTLEMVSNFFDVSEEWILKNNGLKNDLVFSPGIVLHPLLITKEPVAR